MNRRLLLPALLPLVLGACVVSHDPYGRGYGSYTSYNNYRTTQYRYYDEHPTPDGGWCLIVGDHFHDYVADTRYYSYDQTYYRYRGPRVVFYYEYHPVPGGGYCNLHGRHSHNYLPDRGYGRDYTWSNSGYRWRHPATVPAGGNYGGNYGGNRPPPPPGDSGGYRPTYPPPGGGNGGGTPPPPPTGGGWNNPPPGHGGTPPGHGGTPPGQSNDIPPGQVNNPGRGNGGWGNPTPPPPPGRGNDRDDDDDHGDGNGNGRGNGNGGIGDDDGNRGNGNGRGNSGGGWGNPTPPAPPPPPARGNDNDDRTATATGAATRAVAGATPAAAAPGRATRRLPRSRRPRATAAATAAGTGTATPVAVTAAGVPRRLRAAATKPPEPEPLRRPGVRAQRGEHPGRSLLGPAGGRLRYLAPMRLFAIGDTHLPSTRSKDMHRFGWTDHPLPLQRAWDEKVRPEDVVIVAGDISWATRATEVQDDLAWLNARPGRKVLLKGNHDYWWGDSTAKLKKLFEPFPTLEGFLQNSAVQIGPWVIAGTPAVDHARGAPDAGRRDGRRAGEGGLRRARVPAAVALDRRRGAEAGRLEHPAHPDRGGALSAAVLEREEHRVLRGDRGVPRRRSASTATSTPRGSPPASSAIGTQVRYVLASCDAAKFSPVLLDEAG